jgi:hypothetical protein
MLRRLETRARVGQVYDASTRQSARRVGMSEGAK